MTNMFKEMKEGQHYLLNALKKSTDHGTNSYLERPQLKDQMQVGHSLQQCPGPTGIYIKSQFKVHDRLPPLHVERASHLENMAT